MALRESGVRGHVDLEIRHSETEIAVRVNVISWVSSHIYVEIGVEGVVLCLVSAEEPSNFRVQPAGLEIIQLGVFVVHFASEMLFWAGGVY